MHSNIFTPNISEYNALKMYIPISCPLCNVHHEYISQSWSRLFM